MKSTVFAPATIGNVGPGFDCFGLCIEGLGDHITCELIEGASRVDSAQGADSASIPLDPTKNCTIIAAESLLKRCGVSTGVAVSFDKAIPVSGGLGSSAAASVGGALAALFALGKPFDRDLVALAALDGEEAVAGRHLDNIAPCIAGGLTIVRDTDTVDFSRLNSAPPWWITVVTPDYRLDTKAARSVLPMHIDRGLMIAQMAHASSLIMAFANHDQELLSRSLNDLYAEPRRAPLMPGFLDAKEAALSAGALGAGISGAGPTIFALSESKSVADFVCSRICEVYEKTTLTHVGQIASEGARKISS